MHGAKNKDKHFPNFSYFSIKMWNWNIKIWNKIKYKNWEKYTELPYDN